MISEVQSFSIGAFGSILSMLFWGRFRHRDWRHKWFVEQELARTMAGLSLFMPFGRRIYLKGYRIKHLYWGVLLLVIGFIFRNLFYGYFGYCLAASGLTLMFDEYRNVLVRIRLHQIYRKQALT